jgi:hypothetical protein
MKLASMAKKRKLLISLVPGGKQDQGAEFVRYFKRAVPRSARSPVSFSKTHMELRNGSRLRVLAPTENGVLGPRADVIVFEEAELLDREIHDAALPQAGKAATALIYIGTSKFPSVLNDVFEAVEPARRMLTRWEEVVDAGIVDEGAMAALRERMSVEAWREFYECEWVLRGEFAFGNVVVGRGLPETAAGCFVGVDCNMNPGVVWVRVVGFRDGGLPKLRAVAEGVVSHARPEAVLDNIDRHDGVVVESNGFNAGFSIDIVKAGHAAQRRVTEHSWGGPDAKEGNVELAKQWHEQGRLEVDDVACPHLFKALREVRFNIDGRVDKAKSGPEQHYFDAWLHALWGWS